MGELLKSLVGARSLLALRADAAVEAGDNEALVNLLEVQIEIQQAIDRILGGHP